jgi:AcrR family transcriptional regulator
VATCPVPGPLSPALKMSRPASEPLLEDEAVSEPADGRRARGMRSRAAVLERAVQLASRHGLEGLTIGELAAELDVHKSSVFALFGSKVDLQLATLGAARAILIDQVIAPALSSEEGLPRLMALGEAWCDYLLSDIFAGGCFLCAASTEMDGRPGPVRDAVAEVMREWIAVLSANIDTAMTAAQLRRDTEGSALAFRLNALGMAANWQRQLLEDSAGVEHARAGWRAELDRHRCGDQ